MDTLEQEFAAMRAELEAELIAARQHLVDAEAASIEAVATRAACEAACHALQEPVAPLGNTIGGALASQVADKTRFLRSATGDVTRAAMAADGARRRVADLETSIAQLANLITPLEPADELVEVAQ
jgi:hypothetical protein